MRHRNAGRRFSKDSAHRLSDFRNLSAALIRHETIRTTLPKAKELRRFLEPLITMSKSDSIHHRRLVFARLRDREMVTKLFNDLGPFYQARPGGYLRVLKCGFRPGDAAPLAYIQMVGRYEDDADSPTS